MLSTIVLSNENLLLALQEEAPLPKEAGGEDVTKCKICIDKRKNWCTIKV